LDTFECVKALTIFWVAPIAGRRNHHRRQDRVDQPASKCPSKRMRERVRNRNALSPANPPLRHLETGELLVIGAAVAIVRHV
jgi:hypothetical protein